jgi:hypothetical protein
MIATFAPGWSQYIWRQSREIVEELVHVLQWVKRLEQAASFDNENKVTKTETARADLLRTTRRRLLIKKQKQ